MKSIPKPLIMAIVFIAVLAAWELFLKGQIMKLTGKK